VRDRGGGVTFGPHPRSYTFKVNRKEQRAALRSGLSLHAERGSIAIFDSSAFSAPKTRQAFDLLDDWGQNGPTLVVLTPEESDAALSFRNLERVAVLSATDVGVADLLRVASLLVSHAALDELSARAAKPVARSAEQQQAVSSAAGRGRPQADQSNDSAEQDASREAS